MSNDLERTDTNSSSHLKGHLQEAQRRQIARFLASYTHFLHDARFTDGTIGMVKARPIKQEWARCADYCHEVYQISTFESQSFTRFGIPKRYFVVSEMCSCCAEEEGFICDFEDEPPVGCSCVGCRRSADYVAAHETSKPEGLVSR